MGGATGFSYPIDWAFEGSVDGVHWTTLREHFRDKGWYTKEDSFSIMGSPKGYSGHWEIERPEGLPDENFQFCLFRVVMEGKNAQSYNASLVLSGMDIYGTLLHEEPL